jgi:copper chaperone CopZ
MLLASLIGRKNSKKASSNVKGLDSPLLKAPTVLSVTHALPGRTRFRAPILRNQVTASAKLQEALENIEGVHTAQVSPVSSSVLIQHDPEQVAPDLLAAALIRLLGLENELTRDVDATITRELRDFSQAANRAMYEKTSGLLDFKSALMLGLAALGTRKLLQQGTLALPAGFTLLWWAGNGLLKGKQTAS